MDADHPPDEDETHPESVMGPIDAACDRFEAEWKSGQRPRIQDFVSSAPAEGQRRLFLELLGLDIEYRVAAGEAPEASDCTSLIPQFGTLVQSAFLDEMNALSAARPVAGQPVRESEPVPGSETSDERQAFDNTAMSWSGSSPRPTTGSQKPDAIQPYSKFDGYEIIEQVGAGGMGVVYKVRDLRLNRLVAIKMLVAGGHFSPNHVARFRREAETLARLRHPHIVQIHNVGEHDGICYFAMEFLTGGNLDQLVRQHPPGARWSVELVETLARAMQFAHDHGVVHRDLKPANMLLADIDSATVSSKSPGESSRSATLPRVAGKASQAEVRLAVIPKIADFGLARDLMSEDTQTITGQIIGTANFMSPEQTSGMRASPAADVYSLGAILYFLLTGHPPFEGGTSLETLLMVQRSEARPLSRHRSSLPAELNVICQKCLEKDPARRYGSALLLAEDLRRFLNGEPLLAKPVGQLRATIKGRDASGGHPGTKVYYAASVGHRTGAFPRRPSACRLAAE